jgi:hypothetical protein
MLTITAGVSPKVRFASAVSLLHGGIETICISVALVVLLFSSVLKEARGQSVESAEDATNSRIAICSTLENVARANALPIDFFVRLIWRESRFQSSVIGPMTRSGERALGIAQFMPRTASERGLLEPFNPTEALPKSAEFLAQLRDEFGNLGLAAAAYNAGADRVRKFLAGSGAMPTETRNYVLAITGRPVEAWALPSNESYDRSNLSQQGGVSVELSCLGIVAQLDRSPNRTATIVEQRKVPTWCRSLHRPNVTTCGAVHVDNSTTKAIHGAISRVSLPTTSAR